ncbi:heat shock protein 75 kDa, mitochondrial-like [Corticium candelabrum]|uniref:heat shock protein 75 kDa, mitochondrial-like n=1 Tax=Corticium candelabrum TaxID=121492 RepID=UPI002E264E86|nr:heat shock protein 75 kDa, mitochondrial-like [Corticium candelabrum]
MFPRRASSTLYRKVTTVARFEQVRARILNYHRVFGVRTDSYKGVRHGHGKLCEQIRCLACSSMRSSDLAKDEEVIEGTLDRHQFQAETRQLLDIVAKSLYSEKEVFIREVISNASDALERLRCLQATGEQVDESHPMEIRISTDNASGTITLQDFGSGMSREEMIENLGTIAHSGTKAFLSQFENRSDGASLIGQFGVGFYSTFMVARSVTVYSRSCIPGAKGYVWMSDGSGSYDIAEAVNVERGTKVVIHLKDEEQRYADKTVVEGVIQRYSNFVGFPIFLNGQQVNTIQALWMLPPKDVSQSQHEEFYKFIADAYDTPRYHLHFATDAPLNVRALFYIPQMLPEMFGSQIVEPGVNLYSRRVLIQPKARGILPDWMRFVKGVVDSEDIPLNLSRELLQQTEVIRKLRMILTSRLLKFLGDEAKKDRKKYEKFFNDCGLYFRGGLVSAEDDYQKEELAKLFRFESSFERPGVTTSLPDYVSRMKPNQQNIYFLCSTSREVAEMSPYLEPVKAQAMEVLLSYNPYDDSVLSLLPKFGGKTVVSVENYLAKSDDKYKQPDNPNSLPLEQAESLATWLKQTLGPGKVKEVKVSGRLSTHPAMLTTPEMSTARSITRGTAHTDGLGGYLQATLEINPSHPIMRQLSETKEKDRQLAALVAEQVYDNALIAAGLMVDPRRMLTRLNDLLLKTLNKE